jgi:hypothetical protein
LRGIDEMTRAIVALGMLLFGIVGAHSQEVTAESQNVDVLGVSFGYHWRAYVTGNEAFMDFTFDGGPYHRTRTWNVTTANCSSLLDPVPVIVAPIPGTIRADGCTGGITCTNGQSYVGFESAFHGHLLGFDEQRNIVDISHQNYIIPGRSC